MEPMPTTETRPSIVVIGFTSRDTNVFADGTEAERVGGQGYYTALAIHTLGVPVHLITWVAPEDDALLADYRTRGLSFTNLPVQATLHFENRYEDEHGNTRTQRLITPVVTPHFEALPQEALQKLRDASLVYFGTNLEALLTTAFVDNIRRLTDARFAADIGSLFRGVNAEGEILLDRNWPTLDGLAAIDIATVSIEDVPVLEQKHAPEEIIKTIGKHGPAEVLLTLGSHGSILHVPESDRIEPIAPFPVDPVDPTGAGDTFIAGYLAERLQSDDLVRCARFASAAAAQAITKQGPLTTSRGEILQLLG